MENKIEELIEKYIKIKHEASEEIKKCLILEQKYVAGQIATLNLILRDLQELKNGK